ncbi:hypothetical protein DPMN_007143 [Dreissena polymorpha]|uniref:Uncharacterized protein n=1 Tax=Dreissena polymorpha TaxID=45954 RepID=A0A9D4MTS4_DREPO|nr:hypothetical protein DPMN_007143 [Dreissena polymorpha]
MKPRQRQSCRAKNWIHLLLNRELSIYGRGESEVVIRNIVIKDCGASCIVSEMTRKDKTDEQQTAYKLNRLRVTHKGMFNLLLNGKG